MIADLYAIDVKKYDTDGAALRHTMGHHLRRDLRQRYCRNVYVFGGGAFGQCGFAGRSGCGSARLVRKTCVKRRRCGI
jgi:hypothetical protein